MRSVFSATRTMLSELSRAPQDWTFVLPAAAATLIEAGLERLGRCDDVTARSLLVVMTGIKPKWQILLFLRISVDHLKAKTLEHARSMKVIKFMILRDALDVVQKNVSLSVLERRD